MKLIYWMIYWTGYSVSWIKGKLGIMSKAVISEGNREDGDGILLIGPFDEELPPLELDEKQSAKPVRCG